MPIFEYECRDCNRRSGEEIYFSWRDAPKRLPCPCGSEQVRLVGRPVLDTPKVRERNLVPGHVMWEGTPWQGQDMTNPLLPEGHPGHFKENTGHRAYSDLGK